MIHVVGLSLPNNNLIGTLPGSLSGLIYLQDLGLRSNEISGTLPQARSTMVKLTKVNISNNLLEGILPDNWSGFLNLQEFNLSRNNLTGSLPSSWSSLSELSGFDVSNNNLHGELPIVWKNLTGLHLFNIANNQFSGELRPEWSLQTQMRSFNLSGNSFRGMLPSDWGNAWSGVTSLIVTNNHLTGDVPASWINFADLNELQLDYNCFNTDLPEPPATFVDDVAGNDWQDRQTHCIGDLAIEKSVDNAQAFTGTQIVYTLRYINNSTTSIPGVVVSDILAPGLTYVSSPNTSGLLVTGSDISWQIGRVGAQSVNVVKVIAQINGNLNSGAIVTNYASITGLLFDTGSTNNTSNTVQTLIFGMTEPTYG